jgi:hypothetical protein
MEDEATYIAVMVTSRLMLALGIWFGVSLSQVPPEPILQQPIVYGCGYDYLDLAEDYRPSPPHPPHPPPPPPGEAPPTPPPGLSCESTSACEVQ